MTQLLFAFAFVLSIGASSAFAADPLVSELPRGTVFTLTQDIDLAPCLEGAQTTDHVMMSAGKLYCQDQEPSGRYVNLKFDKPRRSLKKGQFRCVLMRVYSPVGRSDIDEFVFQDSDKCPLSRKGAMETQRALFDLRSSAWTEGSLKYNLMPAFKIQTPDEANPNGKHRVTDRMRKEAVPEDAGSESAPNNSSSAPAAR